jgi:micrococcal nuclease
MLFLKSGLRALVVACLFAGLFAGQPVTATSKFTGYLAEVTHVHDGDSLWVQPLEGGRRQRLRLDGIDAPETCQVHGREARDRLAELVLQRQVRVEVTGQDRYRRTLARVWLEDEDVQAVMVAEGWAWSYRVRGQAGPYDRQEAQARRRGLGLFADARPEPPGDFRRRHGPCTND